MLTNDDKKIIREVVADTITDILFPTLENMQADTNHRFDIVDSNFNLFKDKTDKLSEEQKKLKREVDQIKSIPSIAHELKMKKIRS